jgi:hypothetical protein
MNDTLTKKQFEELMNKYFGFDEMSHGNKSLNRKAKSRLYGTYLRNADRDKFNDNHRLYCEGKLSYLFNYLSP